MTTLQNRPNTALLVIDVQAGVVAGNHERDAVVANVATLVDKAREQDVPVVWVQHNDDGLARGSDEWQLVPELKRDDAEPLVEKRYGDSFEDTNLEDVLSDLSVGRLIVAGAQTDHVRALDPARRAGPRLRRHARQRRPHHRGPQPSGAGRRPTW